MIETALERDEMLKVAPDLVRDCEAGLEADAPLPAYVLAWAVAPGGQTVPGPGEQDADEVRAWAERALQFQARGSTGRRGTVRQPRRNFVIPDAVVDHVLALAADGPSVDGRMDVTRVLGDIAAGRPAPAPAPALTPPTPR